MFRKDRTAGCQPACFPKHISPMKGSPKGWHSRGYLPHFDGNRITQFVTFRLANSIPRRMLQQLALKLQTGQIDDIEYHREVERILDRGLGPAYLADESIARILVENLLKFDGIRYRLLHWVIMPNHVHILLTPAEEVSLSSIMHSMKSYTASAANAQLNRTGRFWAVEYFDRYIRDYDHYEKTVAYIHNNPVKAGLSESPVTWPFGCRRLHE